jgi:hypothetical protein
MATLNRKVKIWPSRIRHHQIMASPRLKDFLRARSLVGFDFLMEIHFYYSKLTSRLVNF